MKNILAIATCALTLFSCQNQAQPKQSNSNMSAENVVKETIYQFKVEDLSGKIFDFASLKGKKIIVVNTASRCGNTPQYKDLEAVYNEYKDKGVVVIGFPANNFMSQEPGTNEEIATFCQKNYGVTFPMMSKVSVKGDDMCAMYQFLTQKAKNGLQDSKVDWNFQKYLINEKGELDKVISPGTLVTEAEVMNWIKS
jgi:glutathione peroxidase